MLLALLAFAQPAQAEPRTLRETLRFSGHGCGDPSTRSVPMDSRATGVRIRQPRLGRMLRSEGLSVARVTGVRRSGGRIRVTVRGAGDICGENFGDERWTASLKLVVRYSLKTKTVGRRRAGRLRLGRAREKSVRAEYGVPARVQRSGRGRRRVKILSYGCSQSGCATRFGIALSSLRLAYFYTEDPIYETRRGTAPGMSRREMKRREGSSLRALVCGADRYFLRPGGPPALALSGGRVRALITYTDRWPRREPVGC